MPDPASANATSWLAKFQQKMAALGATGFSSEQFNSAFLSEGSVIGDWPENARLPTLLASLPVRNFELANRMVAEWTAVADEDRPWTRSSKEGVQYYTLPPANPMLPISPSIAVGKELLVAGFDAASVEAAITRSSAASSELGSSNRFTAAERQLPAPAQLFSYVDMELLYSRLDAAVRPMLVMAAAFMPGIANKVDLSKLPPPDVITRHLSPVVISQHYENDGYVTESVGPVSVYHALLGIAAASGGAARWYQQDASKRVQGSPSTVPGLSSPSSPSTSPVSDEQQRAEAPPDS
ncbi:MAG: hypothetical protein H0X73_04560 [Chthoniobacterales bacterium]|nr:hypothetical protein [Chthoniobacterales bacterium]